MLSLRPQGVFFLKVFKMMRFEMQEDIRTVHKGLLKIASICYNSEIRVYLTQMKKIGC